ncbi:hypothetical protein FAM09_25015 [Niastella caeni]|uniref:Lipoprotein n=1 Tax=Niastella caeni TaxID=2569763 RepID=A0A4S8HF24_9BACT|nr:hypothetical protein [Niastella caeni]THU33415.1 hypothetical protein FAM09_25015 [Niastella caeni]
MKKLVLPLLALLVLTNCAGNDSASEDTPKASTAKTKTSNTKKAKAAAANPSGFKLDFIKSIPGSIDGCGEFFTYDTCKLTEEKYIFLSDMGDMAIIRIKGKDITLKKNTRESKQLNAISSVEVYYAVGYKVVLRKKEVKVADEFYEYSGTLQITGKKIKTTFKVRGEGGC